MYVCHCMCIKVRSSPYRRIFLLGIAHPVLGPPFRYKEMTLRRGRVCEGRRHVALSNIFVKVFVLKDFYKILLDYCMNSWVCNYSKRVMIRFLRTVIECFIFIF